MYRQLDRMRAEVKARTAWMDELTEEEIEAMLRGLAECVEAMESTGGDAPERPEGPA
ncbi:hypothetical protein [Streptomyces sirii]|uniref:hypothetical protein n=1 Tax=Streptomyces sirii TaxID=3127701 RepID=UPI003D35D84A